MANRCGVSVSAGLCEVWQASVADPVTDLVPSWSCGVRAGSQAAAVPLTHGMMPNAMAMGSGGQQNA